MKAKAVTVTASVLGQILFWIVLTVFLLMLYPQEFVSIFWSADQKIRFLLWLLVYFIVVIAVCTADGRAWF